MLSNILILIHPALGMFAILCTVWLLLEAINATAQNQHRIQKVSLYVAILMFLTWIIGGYWYVVFYHTDKAIILQGTWPFAHSFFMEVKEHLFFIVLILALYLPLIAKRNMLYTNELARRLLITVSTIVIVLSLFIEGAGAIISQGVKVSLDQNNSKEITK